MKERDGEGGRKRMRERKRNGEHLKEIGKEQRELTDGGCGKEVRWSRWER